MKSTQMATVVGDIWEVYARIERLDGKPISVKPGFIVWPVFRLVLWMQLSQLGNGISRAFR